MRKLFGIMNKKSFILILTFLGFVSLQAQNIIRPKVECPNGIYVNSYNGVLFYQRPDVSIANRNMRLEAVFYYNSSSNKKNYGYGNGWSLGSELRFVNDSLGIIIEQGDGRQDLYTRYGNSFEAPAGVFSTLSIEGDGYKLSYKDGTKYYFTDTVAKKVTQVRDRYDNAITFAYQNGNLISSTDISGRSLYFSWNNGLLSGMSTSFDDRTWSYQYDEKGNLTGVTDPMGYTVHYEYNKDNRIKTFTDAEGYSTHISYNIDGMAHRVKTDVTDKSIRYELANHQTIFVDYLSDANNQYTKYVWDEKGRLVEILNVNTSASTKFAFDDDNNMIRREDANGNVTTYTYDQNGNRLSETDPLGHTEYYTYENTYNKVTSYIDKMGHLYTYNYDSNGDLLQMNGPLNYKNTMTYNSFGQVQTISDALDNTYSFDYDNYGNTILSTNPLGNVTKMSYSPSGLRLTLTQANAGVIQTFYDKNERVVSVVDAMNNTIGLSYDKNGRINSYMDGRMNSINLIYDVLGRVIQSTDQQGGLRKYFYDAQGNLLSLIDEKGLVYKNRFNDCNLLKYSLSPLNDSICCYYDNMGNVIGLKMPNGRFVTTQFDALNRAVLQSDQLGVLSYCEYDANGNVLSCSDANGHNYSFEYDALGRLISMVDALGNVSYYSYDVVGNLITETDRNGHTKIYSYDAMYHLISETDPLGNVTNYSYDEMGNMVQKKNAMGGVTCYEYDLKSQLSKITYPDGTSRKYWHDANGNVTIVQDELGAMVYYTYNNVNQLVRVDYPSQTSDIYVYDLSGNLLSAINENAVVNYLYDDLGRLSSESINGVETSYQYDSDYQYVIMNYPSGKSYKQELDLRGRVQSVIDLMGNSVVASFMYNGINQVIRKDYDNGFSTSYSYDACGNVSEIFDNHQLLHYELCYDAEGNLIVRKDLANPAKSQQYFYDANDQLIEFLEGTVNECNTIVAPAITIQYDYNPLGAISSENTNGMFKEFSVNTLNAITSVMGDDEAFFRFDVVGNMVEDKDHSYQYNGRNQLAGVDQGNTSLYLYDALGRRIQRTVNEGGDSKTENYYYSGMNLIESDDVFSHDILSTVFSLDGQAIQSVNGTQCFYYHSDQNGSTVAMTKDNGLAVECYSYNPLGQVSFFDAEGNAQVASSINNNLLYLGDFWDNETNLSHNFAGGCFNYIVNSTTGQFTQKGTVINLLDGIYQQKASIDNNLLVGVYNIANTANGMANNEELIVSLFNSPFLQGIWAKYDLNYRLQNGVPISKTFSQYKEVMNELDNIGKMIDKTVKIIDATHAVTDIPQLIDGWKNSSLYDEKMVHFGCWIEDLYLDFCPPLAAVDWVYKKTAKFLYGEEPEGLVVLAMQGYGMALDCAGQALDNSCSAFQRSGYNNATIFQQTMADVINHPLNVVGNIWNLKSRLFNYGFELGEKWFPVK